MDFESELANKKCVPCRGGNPPFKGKEINELMEKLDDGWNVRDEHHLEKEYPFPNFKLALAYTNRVGDIAEKEGHHPDIYLSWGKVKIILWTHKIDGLTESDFIIAAKCDQVFEKGDNYDDNN